MSKGTTGNVINFTRSLNLKLVYFLHICNGEALLDNIRNEQFSRQITSTYKAVTKRRPHCILLQLLSGSNMMKMIDRSSFDLQETPAQRRKGHRQNNDLRNFLGTLASPHTF